MKPAIHMASALIGRAFVAQIQAAGRLNPH